MNNKVFFHFGLPRTGSTTVQHNIFPELEDYLFVCAPYTQENVAFNKLQYADDILFQQQELADTLAFIRKQSPDKGILISDENFFGSPNANFMNRSHIAKRLAACCPEAELILFIRDQRSLIQSLYNQFVKSGSFFGKMSKGFISSPGRGLAWQQYISAPPKWTRELRYIDYQAWMSIEHFFYDDILDFYKAHFSQVHVVLYEEFSENPVAVMKKLEEIFDSRFTTKAYDALGGTPKNASLSSRQLYRVSLGNRIKSAFPHVPEPISRQLSKLISLVDGGDYEKSLEMYLRSIVGDQELTDRNILANEKHALGMERFPGKYFPAL